MGILDLIIAFFILIGLWRGYKTGFVRSLISLVGWFVALVAATRLADDVAPQLVHVVSSPVLQMGLGFLVVVLIVMVAIQLLGSMTTSLLEGMRLGLLNQMAGAVLGAAKSILVVLILLSVLAPLLVRLPLWQSSVLAPELMPYAPFGKQFATKVLGDAWHQIDRPSQ